MYVEKNNFDTGQKFKINMLKLKKKKIKKLFQNKYAKTKKIKN